SLPSPGRAVVCDRQPTDRGAPPTLEWLDQLPSRNDVPADAWHGPCVPEVHPGVATLARCQSAWPQYSEPSHVDARAVPPTAGERAPLHRLQVPRGSTPMP